MDILSEAVVCNTVEQTLVTLRIYLFIFDFVNRIFNLKSFFTNKVKKVFVMIKFFR